MGIENAKGRLESGERERSSAPLPLPYRSRTDVDSAGSTNVASCSVIRPGPIAAHVVISSQHTVLSSLEALP